MCGICGHLDYSSRRMLSKGELRAFASRMHSRGPDDEGYHQDDVVSLGMRRLSLIDLEGGAQPIYNEERTIAVIQNGEIYSFRELRKELESLGHRFSSNSDTDVLGKFLHLKTFGSY